MDSLALSNSLHSNANESTKDNSQIEERPSVGAFESGQNSDNEDKMWDYVIEKHGRVEFQAVYNIIDKLREQRFSEEGQRVINEQVAVTLSHLGMNEPLKQQELIGLVGSFMIIEE
eukprot:CAMPEP_0168610640 /NCGR_PEP_ID=MMETSP0449_2-20121227/1898_1 /TAXON_ID=1082188 /ORGANISM="Strombidium rassoulzadegani, Strain ras09" /LENGTH=115 /DNA_ID=CAMNT_0008650965 /DNA_START=515 /DNA_END=859 /DNA_ORIENTATION=-